MGANPPPPEEEGAGLAEGPPKRPVGALFCVAPNPLAPGVPNAPIEGVAGAEPKPPALGVPNPPLGVGVEGLEAPNAEEMLPKPP